MLLGFVNDYVNEASIFLFLGLRTLLPLKMYFRKKNIIDKMNTSDLGPRRSRPRLPKYNARNKLFYSLRLLDSVAFYYIISVILIITFKPFISCWYILKFTIYYSESVSLELYVSKEHFVYMAYLAAKNTQIIIIFIFPPPTLNFGPLCS